MPNTIYYGDNLPILAAMPSESVDLIYIDPPFNTGTTQVRTQLKTVRSETGDRTGFQGRRYETIKLGHQVLCRSVRQLSRLPAAAPDRGVSRTHINRLALLPH